MPSAIIPCVAWVARGKAKEKPEKVSLTKEEARELWEAAREDLRLQKNKEKKKRQKEKKKAAPEAAAVVDAPDEDEAESNEETDEELAEYDFEHYDEEEDQTGIHIEGAGMGTGLMGLAYHASNDDDPYVTLREGHLSSEEEEEDSELIRPTDNLLLVGKVDEEVSTMEVLLVNEAHAPYVHHDQMLDSFPLVMEWLDFDVQSEGQRGNLVAVGGMLPYIEIWDLDVIDSVKPVVKLGETKRKKKHRSSRGGSGRGGGHTDSVLGLSWNGLARHLLASASADCTVGLWDLRSLTCEQKLSVHSDKVQSVAWHPYEAQSLVSGSMDQRCCAMDCRDPQNSVRSWRLSGEVEQVVWNQFEPFQFLAACDDGHVFSIDVRNTDKPLYQIAAHNKAVNNMALSKQVPGLLATVGGDAALKIWDIANARPSCVHSAGMGMGELLTVRFCPDMPFALGLGGTINGVRVLDLRQFAPVRSHFADRQPSLVDFVPGDAGASGFDARMDVDDGMDDDDDDDDDIDGDHGIGAGTSSHGAAAAGGISPAGHGAAGSVKPKKKKKKRMKNKK